METSFPFTTFEWKKDLATSVEIAIPFRIFRILEMGPHIIVEFLEPLKTLFITCELITLDHTNSRFEVHPP